MDKYLYHTITKDITLAEYYMPGANEAQYQVLEAETLEDAEHEIENLLREGYYVTLARLITVEVKHLCPR